MAGRREGGREGGKMARGMVGKKEERWREGAKKIKM